MATISDKSQQCTCRFAVSWEVLHDIHRPLVHDVPCASLKGLLAAAKKIDGGIIGFGILEAAR